MDSAILIMLGAVAFVAILLLVIIATTRKAPAGINVEDFRAKWLKIENELGEDEPSCHLAVINADKLLDQALKAKGTKGDTMGERLKNVTSQLRHRNAVWEAHKLRNRIVHEEVRLTRTEARRALAAFKTALRDVGAI